MPAATNAIVTIAADATTNLTLHGGDLDGKPLAFTVTSAPTNGLTSSFNPTNGTLNYTPPHGSTHSDALAYVVNNGQFSSTPGQLTINIAPPVDANTNGMPDAWETQFGITDPATDDDGDGATSLQEYWAGTNPTNALSWLHFTQIGAAGAGYQVVWSSVGGTRYRVQFSDGDASGSFNGLFTPVPRAVSDEMDSSSAGTAGTMSFTDDFTLTGGAPANGARYYRVEVMR